MYVTNLKKTRQLLPTRVERVTFVLQADNRKEVLAQVVLRFQSLNVEIDALYFVRTRGSDSMWMRITIQTDRQGARVVEAELNRIMGVKSVNTERGANDHLDATPHVGKESLSCP
jgi:acetolactate synthase small subunit